MWCVYRPHLAVAMATMHVTVTNTGSRCGDQVVLALVQSPGAGQDGEPIAALRRYDRVAIDPGQSKVVSFGFTCHDLATFDKHGRARTLVGDWIVSIQGANVQFVVKVID